MLSVNLQLELVLTELGGCENRSLEKHQSYVYVSCRVLFVQ